MLAAMTNSASSLASLTTGAPVNALDFRGLADIQRLAKTNDPTALKAAAQQFEALFLQMVLKSMRDATPKDGLFDNEQTTMYQSLLDSQLAQVLSSKKGVGLAAVLEKQLSQTSASPNADDVLMRLDPGSKAFDLMRARSWLATPAKNAAPVAVSPAPTFQGDSLPANPAAQSFVSRVLPDAQIAAAQTGIPAVFLVAQAALETGWGKSEPRTADGKPSFNLFGIKAGRHWDGDSVEASTTEFVQGIAQRRTERFRAYGSYAESFRDYARLISENPRYAGVVGAQDAKDFARGLQSAGYATDPAYASKLERVIASLSTV